MSWTAESLYGVPGVGSSGVTTLSPAASSGAPTSSVAGRPHLLANPTFWIVAILAVAFGLVHFSLRLA